MTRKQASTIVTSLTVMAYVGMTEYAAAAQGDYGKNAADWASDQLKAIWVVLASAGALAFFFPGVRKPAILFGFLGAVFLTGLVIFAPNVLETMIKTVGKRIESGA